MQYTQAIFKIKSETDFAQDVLTQQLADIGYESFVEQEDGNYVAYIKTQEFSETLLKQVMEEFPFKGITLIKTELCEDKDWNEEWERNSFQPIQIGEECVIHAPFHKDLPTCKYEIVINPKMAFGTGTHQTTSLIINELLQLDLQSKAVLDMGCGTAVLAILARMRGAQPVTAIDIDNWCTENAQENCTLNNINDIEILLGDARLIEGRHFDIVIANINRNILLMDMQRYAEAINAGGALIMSGFYTEDIPTLAEKASSLGLSLEYKSEKDNWAMVRMRKGMK